MAGLLTYASSYLDSFPHQRRCSGLYPFVAVTVAGTVPDFHRIPY